MKGWTLASVGVMLLATASPSVAATPTETTPVGVLREPSTVDSAAISKILIDQDAAWAVGDAAGYTARVLPEILFTNVVGAYSTGKAPLFDQVQKIFSTIYKGSTVKTKVVSISMIGDDVAIVETITKLTHFSKPAMDSVVVNGATYSRLQETMIRRNGSWWIAAIHNVFIIPPLVPKSELSQ